MTLDEFRCRCRMCGECWEWISDAKSMHHRRHPQIKLNGKVQLVRRLIFVAAGGVIQNKRKLLPNCGNPFCVNPEHQTQLTESQKGKRAAAKGVFSTVARCKRVADGRRQSQSKLTLEQAQEIRHSNESGPVLAARYGIHKSRVNAIKRGEAWKDYSSPFAGLFAMNDSGRKAA